MKVVIGRLGSPQCRTAKPSGPTRSPGRIRKADLPFYLLDPPRGPGSDSLSTWFGFPRWSNLEVGRQDGKALRATKPRDCVMAEGGPVMACLLKNI